MKTTIELAIKLALITSLLSEPPASPVKGQGNARESFGYRRAGLGLAIWEAIPNPHKEVLKYGDGSSLAWRGTASNIVISPEAAAVVGEVMEMSIDLTEAALIIGDRRIPAPSGTSWVERGGLCLVRKTDGMDFHPDAADVLANDFATRVKKAMSENFKARRLSAQIAKEKAKYEAIFRRDIKTTRVTISDSRRAGNCVEGTLFFCEKKLGLSRSEILAAGHLFSASAAEVLARANGQTDRAEAAVRQAWLRETTISI